LFKRANERGKKMAKRFLMALDKSSNSLRAVEFVADTIKPTAQLTLMSIVANPATACELDGPSLIPLFTENIKTFCSIEDAKKDVMQGFLDEAKIILVKAGFPANNIAVEIRKQQTGVASDILMVAKEEKYDAVIVGRRGITGVEQFMFGSVSSKVINHAGKLSIIVID
jgi:nucleotide-binding universal stress UspA family protein